MLLSSDDPPARLTCGEPAVPRCRPDLSARAVPHANPQARRSVGQAPNGRDRNTKTLFPRSDGLEPQAQSRAVADARDPMAKRPNRVTIPKAGQGADGRAVDMPVTRTKDAGGLTQRVGVGPILQTAPGTRNAAGTRTRADGLRPVVGPFGGFPGPEGNQATADLAAVLTCKGRGAIPAGQIALANAVKSLSAAPIKRAQGVGTAMARGKAEGRGAGSLKKRRIDAALIPQARERVRKAPRIAA